MVDAAAVAKAVGKSNLSLYWVLATGLGVWFLFVHSPPILLRKSPSSESVFVVEQPFFALHLFGAYLVYMACMYNTMITPPGSGKRAHLWVGRMGLLAGTVGFVAGLFQVIARWDDLDTGFSIGITVGGFMQMKTQFAGYRAIRKYQRCKRRLAELAETNDTSNSTTTPPRADDSSSAKKTEASEEELVLWKSQLRDERDAALRAHIDQMVALFVLACGTPAMMRVVERCGFRSPIVNLLAMVPMNFFKASYARHLVMSLKSRGLAVGITRSSVGKLKSL